jgi:hypothetical protein
MQCGREPDGKYAKKYGTCPVATKVVANGLNEGTNGGRICWVIAENGCKGKVKCSDRHRKYSCFQCEFRYKVIADEGLLNVCNATASFLENSNYY